MESFDNRFTSQVDFNYYECEKSPDIVSLQISFSFQTGKGEYKKLKNL